MASVLNGFYEMEELLPVVAWLTDRYTSKESSSVTYEKAQMLMGAVIYCMQESLLEKKAASLPVSKKPPAMEMYRKGYQIILDKTYRAKEIYESIIQNFNDYRCKNYKDTIIHGIPEFFIQYDPRFCPQDEILTLDYPLICVNQDLQGVSLILDYLEGILTEKRLLDSLDSQVIRSLLEKESSEYRELYLDNICFPVIVYLIQCFIVERPANEYRADKADIDTVRSFFMEDDFDKVVSKINFILHQIMRHEAGMAEYFTKGARNYAVKVLQSISKLS